MKTLKPDPRKHVGFPSLQTLKAQLDSLEEHFLSCTIFAYRDRVDQKTSRDPFQSRVVCDSVSHKIPYTWDRKKASRSWLFGLKL